MNIAVADDDRAILTRTEARLREYGERNGINIECSCFERVDDFIRSLKARRYSIVLMDVNFIGQDKTGIDAAAVLRETDPVAILVFLTDSPEHMPDAFAVHAFSYILKSRMYEMMDRVIDEALKVLPESKTLMFTAGRQNCRVSYAEIVTVCTEGHYLIITDAAGTEYKTRMTFGEISRKLESAPYFLFINKGVLVNMNYIRSIEDGSCCMINGRSLPVRIRDAAKIAQKWNDFLFSSIRREQTARTER